MKHVRFAGMIPPFVTPFDERGHFVAAAMERVIGGTAFERNALTLVASTWESQEFARSRLRGIAFERHALAPIAVGT